MNDFIEYKGSKLYYYKQGTGRKSILVFHGFGQDHSAFASWIEKLKDEYTLISFDLFFHGSSVWVAPDAVDKEDWGNIMETLIYKEKLEDIELAGFSMGGKFAFATLEMFPAKVRRMILIAPDGIKINFWYRLATYPIAMRALFESVVASPKLFFSLARSLEAIGVINKYLLRFVVLQMDTPQKRHQVYCTWIQFRLLRFDMRFIAELINKEKIDLKVIVGKHDKVIPATDMHRLLKYVPSAHLEVIDGGHNNLIDKAAEFL